MSALPFLFGGALISAVGAVQQGKAAEAAAEANAKNMEQQAQQERVNASLREDDQRREARAQIGRQLAGTAESGVLLNGTAADLFRQSLFNAETDAGRIRYEGETRARGQEAQAIIERFQGKQAKKAGYMSALGDLASIPGKAYGMAGGLG